MSIRFRLLLSFSSVVIVSVILFVAAAYLLSVAVTGDFRSISSFYRIHYSLHPLSDEEESIFLDLKYMAKHDPAQLRDADILESYDFQLKMVQASLIVRENDRIVYATPTLREDGLEKLLPPYEMGNYGIRNTMNLGSRFFSYAKFDFAFPDEAEGKGSIYVLRERSPFAELVRTLLPILIAVFVAVLLLTGLLLYRYVTRKIVKPLDELRRSAELIKEGNLTYRLKPQSGDEVGQLVMSFEAMRAKLDESVQLQLRYEENRKGLISNISHDLRTPITTIKGYAEGIRDGVTNTEEKLKRYVDAIHTRASDMERLVDELLFISKLDLNKEPYSFERLELGAFLRRTLGEMAIELEQRNVSLVWEMEESLLLHVLADREKLRRVIVNLADNGMKYMKDDPKILTIGMEESGEHAIIRISDNGPGIDAEALPHIFERFYRGEPSRSPNTPGSGLGLAIAKGIMDGHGGQIWAESASGRGTAVFLSLRIHTEHL
ncbi:HAMP domain-containing sensor histidine kinase [Paenibacillus sp. LHD-117]|uniref:sensor histidine kinase n=1 Tax=Paenibacillus sp. LHD-117 TaxID=3071412 RepID=UPI0027E1E0FE|nr:HAMP domain-containing sensor histidine kinase [Paenibacillus sp. LHD-117]MDQ6422282.1 HAMP domain-containing sensor histidine kinase [Paenibacillus sp. LHD-117]